MATVFLAQQESLDRPVAIKVLPKKFSENSDFIDRFYKEGKAAAKLNHPNIVQAYDVGQSGDYHYIVMEYVDGETVYEEILNEGQVVRRQKRCQLLNKLQKHCNTHMSEVSFTVTSSRRTS